MTALDLRAADPQQRAMLHTYLADVSLPPQARVVEVGCGTGAVTCMLATWPGVGETIGVDPSPVFVAKAWELAGGLPTVVFEGDYATGTLATHAGDPLQACADAFREHFIHAPWLVREVGRE
jgi:trans-aconitate methyltransferase